jgi:hypothetical protein
VAYRSESQGKENGPQINHRIIVASEDDDDDDNNNNNNNNIYYLQLG